MEWNELMKEYIEEEVKLLQTMNQNVVQQVLDALLKAYESDSTIYVFGNGGSASTASHMANDFNKGISEHLERRFRVTCLNDNTATLLALANDICYEDIFSFQLKNKMKPGDVAIGISGSGNSQNIINALNYANSIGATSIGWVGFDGGTVSKISDIVFHVPIHNMQIVEDFHLIINHLMMFMIMKKWNLKGHC